MLTEKDLTNHVVRNEILAASERSITNQIRQLKRIRKDIRLILKQQNHYSNGKTI